MAKKYNTPTSSRHKMVEAGETSEARAAIAAIPSWAYSPATENAALGLSAPPKEKAPEVIIADDDDLDDLDAPDDELVEIETEPCEW